MSNEQDEEIETLIQELEHLQVRIGAVNERLRVLGNRRSSDSTQFTTRNDSEVVGSEGAKHRRSKRDKTSQSAPKTKHIFEVGDRIRIKNPTKKQPIHVGFVTGYTTIGYVQFELDDGAITCRAPKNLILIEKAN